MPRNQQKAVFANMTDDRYLATLEGAEKHRQRRDYLLKRNDLAETYEDKIVQVYNSSKLTHRQKMAKIAGLKKEAKKKLDAYQEGQSGSIAGEIRADNLRKFNKQYSIEEVPVNPNQKSITDIADAPMEKLIKERLVVERKKEVEAKEQIRAGMSSLQEGIKGIGQAKEGKISSAIQKTREANVQINRGRQKLVMSKRKQAELEKALNKTSFSKDPAVRKKQVEKISKEISSELEAIGKEKGKCPIDNPKKKSAWFKKLSKDKKQSWKDVKKKWPTANPEADYDKDGVKNVKDCKPFDKKKQDLTSSVIKGAEKTVAAYQKSRTPKARIKKAKEKLAKLRRQREAERLEQEVKEEEAAYKKAHPKKFGII